MLTMRLPVPLYARLGRRGPSPATACGCDFLYARLGRRGPSPATACDCDFLYARLGRRGPSPATACDCALPFHADGLAVAQLFGSRGDHLLAVREAGDDLLLVAARLAEAHRSALHLALAVHEHGRRAALLDQRRARDQHAPR